MPNINHQKETKLKANVADLVGALLKHLKLAKGKFSEDSDIIKIIADFSTKVGQLEDYFGKREKWESELIKCIGGIVRQTDKWIENDNKRPENDEYKTLTTNLEDIVNRIVRGLQENPQNITDQPRENASQMSESSNSDDDENEGHGEPIQCMTELSPQLQNCVYSLCVFPAKTQLKKRLLLYWWISLFFDPSKEKKTAEDFGHTIFYILMCKGILIPVYFREHNQVVDRCMVEPRIHRQLTTACKDFECKKRNPEEEGIWHFYKTVGGQKALLNLDQMYLNSEDISSNISDVHVFQLGRWRYIEVQDEVQHITTTGEVKSKDHIEVDDTKFLKKVGEKTTYLSFQGISGIQQLPESVGKLRDLMILDLRACHNLETLPEKTEPISPWSSQKWFKRLTHLDITECYLLDHMPKWISELSNLEVLKGFVVGGGANNKQFCRIADLSKLKKLTKLSIKVANIYLAPEDFNGLKTLEKLLVLTITWGPLEQSIVPNRQTMLSGDPGKKNLDVDKNEKVKESSRENAIDGLGMRSHQMVLSGDPGKQNLDVCKNEIMKESSRKNADDGLSMPNHQTVLSGDPGKQNLDIDKNEIVMESSNEKANNSLIMPNRQTVFSGDPGKQNLDVDQNEIVMESIWENTNNGLSMPNHQRVLIGDPSNQNLDVHENEIVMESTRENANNGSSIVEAENGQTSGVSKDETKVTEKNIRKNVQEKQNDEETKTSEQNKPTFPFPKNLEKLDIRCYPNVEAPELLNPKQLTSLKRLYIRGGKLTNIGVVRGWNVEILRLRFIENLKIDGSLHKSFKNLKYLECEKYCTPSPGGVSSWTWKLEINKPLSDRQIATLQQWELDVRRKNMNMGVVA